MTYTAVALLTVPALAGITLLITTFTMQLREHRPTVSPIHEDTTPAHILNIREKREPLTEMEQDILNKY